MVEGRQQLQLLLSRRDLPVSSPGGAAEPAPIRGHDDSGARRPRVYAPGKARHGRDHRRVVFTHDGSCDHSTNRAASGRCGAPWARRDHRCHPVSFDRRATFAWQPFSHDGVSSRACTHDWPSRAGSSRGNNSRNSGFDRASGVRPQRQRVNSGGRTTRIAGTDRCRSGCDGPGDCRAAPIIGIARRARRAIGLGCPASATEAAGRPRALGASDRH